MIKKKSNRSRAVARINPMLDKNLVAYIAAAGAAGVSLLAAQPAQGKVVYTPANVSSTTISIDLNNDGIADFTITRREEASHSVVMVVIPDVKGNAVLPHSPFGAAAGFFGVPVGAGEKFVSNTAPSYGPGVSMARDFGYGNYSSIRGPWVNTTNRYLGIRFLINGETHYGWARLSVSSSLSTVLTGYAYETIPNKTIIEGHTSGPEKAGSFAPSDLLVPISKSATLGMLARGAVALSIWLRDEENVSNDFKRRLS